MGGIPPNEISDGCGGGEHDAEREEEKGYSASHGNPKYSTGVICPRRSKLPGAARAATVFAHGEDITPTVCATDRADVMRGPGTAALRTDDQVRD